MVQTRRAAAAAARDRVLGDRNLLGLILSRLPLRDRCRAAAACKRFNSDQAWEAISDWCQDGHAGESSEERELPDEAVRLVWSPIAQGRGCFVLVRLLSLPARNTARVGQTGRLLTPGGLIRVPKCRWRRWCAGGSAAWSGWSCAALLWTDTLRARWRRCRSARACSLQACAGPCLLARWRS